MGWRRPFRFGICDRWVCNLPHNNLAGGARNGYFTVKAKNTVSICSPASVSEGKDSKRNMGSAQPMSRVMIPYLPFEEGAIHGRALGAF